MLDVKIGDVEGIIFNEGSPGGDILAHEHTEDAVGECRIGDIDFE